MNKEPMFYEINTNSWQEAKTIARSDWLMYFVFRGHSDNKWSLKTSIERIAEQYQNSSLISDQLGTYESLIIEKFRSRAHHYLPFAPKDDELAEWLALIQDFGGPTRLLDFTESFYIAAFFAVENAIEDACVWGIEDFGMMYEMPEEMSPESPMQFRQSYNIEKRNLITKLAQSVILDGRKSQDTILIMRPNRMNERMAVQKGLFVFPCNINKSFESNLCSAFRFPFSTLESRNATVISSETLLKKSLALNYYETPHIIKLNLSKQWHKEILNDLYHMNIDSASLFPGLDGFARSLKFVIQSDEFTPAELGGRA